MKQKTVRISIHALRGEGDSSAMQRCVFVHISIHALRGEGDLIDDSKAFIDLIFQSTPSVGRATYCPHCGAKMNGGISIHALRGEGD